MNAKEKAKLFQPRRNIFPDFVLDFASHRWIKMLSPIYPVCQQNSKSNFKSTYGEVFCETVIWKSLFLRVDFFAIFQIILSLTFIKATVGLISENKG